MAADRSRARSLSSLKAINEDFVKARAVPTNQALQDCRRIIYDY